MKFATHIRRRWRRFCDDRQAVVLAEMAMAMPVVIVLALGGFEIARFTLVQQKLDRLSVTVADMVAQAETMSAGQLDQIFAATGPILAPFTMSSDGVVIVSSVSATGGTGARAACAAKQGGCRRAGLVAGAGAQRRAGAGVVGASGGAQGDAGEEQGAGETERRHTGRRHANKPHAGRPRNGGLRMTLIAASYRVVNDQ